MLKGGIIKLSQSEWRNLQVLLPKPDRKICFGINFREDQAKLDAYLMLRADILSPSLGRPPRKIQ